MMIPETGAGVPGANSYASLERADAYHRARMNPDWIAADVKMQEAALIRATDYIEATYSRGGTPASAAQALQLPVEGIAGLPGVIVTATIMLALYALKGPLLDPTPRGVSKSTKKLEGVGELMTEYDPARTGDAYPAITSLLAGVAKRRGDTGSTGALLMGQLVR